MYRYLLENTTELYFCTNLIFRPNEIPDCRYPLFSSSDKLQK